MAGLSFFAVNCWILGIMVRDIGNKSRMEQKKVGGEIVEGDEGRGESKKME